MAVILNDLKEWSEFIPKDDPDYIVNILDNYLLNNCFIIDRIPTKDNLAYVNVNTPQTNDTWKRIWDGLRSEYITDLTKETEKPEDWTPDPNCETQIVYFWSVDKDGEKISNLQYLENTYGVYGLKLKTICEKMNIFIDRETNKAWYLSTDCVWTPVGSTTTGGMDYDDVLALILAHKIKATWTDEDNIELSLVQKNQLSPEEKLRLLTESQVEAMV